MKHPDAFAAVCAGENVRTRFCGSLLKLLSHRDRFGTGGYILAIGGPFLVPQRNQAVRTFLSSQRPWLLFLDSDVTFEPEDVDKLFLRAKRDNGDVVCGTYGTDDGTTVREGAGFMLVHRRVFEAIGEDWFAHMDRKERRPGEEAQWSEDISFVLRAREHGFKVISDEGIRVGHLKVVEL